MIKKAIATLLLISTFSTLSFSAVPVNRLPELTKIAGIPFQIKVLPDKTMVNAYSDGTNIYISEAMLNHPKITEQEVIFTLLHEYSHHTHQEVVNYRKVVGGLTELLNVFESPETTQAANQLAKLIVYAQERDVEYRSDRDASLAMQKLGYTNSFCKIFKDVITDKDKGSMDDIYSDHPSSYKRYALCMKIFEVKVEPKTEILL